MEKDGVKRKEFSSAAHRREVVLEVKRKQQKKIGDNVKIF